MRMKFTQVDLSRFTKKKIKKEGQKEVWYDLKMACEVGLADPTGVLSFTVTCGGEPIGESKFVCQMD